MTIELLDEEIAEQPADAVSLALTTVTQQIAEFSVLDAGFAELEQRHKDVVYAVDTTKGMEDAKKARMEVRQVRFNAQNLLKATKDPLNKLKADLDATASKIIARITAIEDPIDEQIKAEEAKKAIAKAAADEAERLLAETLQGCINGIAFDPRMALATVEELEEEIDRIEGVEVSLEVFGKRAGEAAQTQMSTIELLTTMRENAVAAELAQQQLAEQRHQLAQEQAQIAAERAAIAAERVAAQAKADAEALAARVKAEAETAELRRQEKAIRDEEDRIENEARALEQKRLDDLAAAERKRLDAIAMAERAEKQRVQEEQDMVIAIAEAKCRRVRNAAPEMLGTLQATLALIRSGAAFDTDALAESIERVIEQATGEPA